MELECLGSSREVGRSGFVLDTGNERILLDYGIQVNTGMEGSEQPGFPLDTDLDLEGVLISHAHMDHGGYVPSLYNRGYHGPVYSTATSFDLMEILLNDSLKLAGIYGYDVRYTKKDIKEMKKNAYRVTYGQAFDVGTTLATYRDAGHIPGSGQIVMEAPEGTVLYSGDIKLEKTELLDGLEPVQRDIDTLIVESTYGTKEHPDREETEREMISKVRETIHDGGVALIASFAVGRSQELLTTLEKYGIDAPIYVDGMCKIATEITLRYSEFLRYPKMLSRAFNRAIKVRDNGQRDEALNGPSVIVTTSGMLNGGPVAYYLERLKDRKDCYLAMTGYQAEGSAGRHLLETGVYKDEEDGKEFDVSMPYERFDFSAHAGQDELLAYVEDVDPDRVICIHGDETPEFADILEDRFGVEAVAPDRGDTVEV